jgi:hypothetical protein
VGGQVPKAFIEASKGVYNVVTTSPAFLDCILEAIELEPEELKAKSPLGVMAGIHQQVQRSVI